MKSIRIALSPTRNRPLNVFLGLVLSLVSLLLLLSLITYHAADPSLNTATDAIAPSAVHNWIGLFGAWMSDLLLQALGLTAFFLPLWLGGIGWTWMHSRPSGSFALRWIGTLLALAFLPAVMGLLPWHTRWLQLVPIEGVVGRLMTAVLVRYLNIQGAWVVASVLAGAGIYFASAVSFWSVWESVQNRWFQVSGWHDRWRSWREEREELRQIRRAEKAARRSSIAQPEQGQQFIPGTGPESGEEEMQEAFARRPHRLMGFFRRDREEDSDALNDVPAFQRAAAVEEPPVEIPVSSRAAKPSIWERTVAEPLPAPVESVEPVPIKSNVVAMQPRQDQPRQEPARQEQARQEQTRQEQPRPTESRVAQPRPAAPPFQSAPAPAPATVLPPAPRPAADIAIHNRADSEARTAPVAPKNVSGFKLPPSTLLNPGDGPQAVREDELRREAKVLVEKYAEFDVRGQVVQINPGPMVTTYEFKPEAGVKYSRVTGLADDLCLAMRAESILIERMAGKSTVGIQVPNHERETIHLRDVIESDTFAKAKSRLTLAMGKDINGRIVTADLASMPHVLIAGSTGSGKSVAINAMIMSLLFRTTPSQVRLILVDPKRVELGMYEGIPHLFTPIITDPKLAANALRNAVREMERRLKLLASRSVRNIDQYNKLFEGATPSLFQEDSEVEEEPLPYIVIIIDELADLMMLDRANVEESITRLAQMARAVGIHLILATQRPSVDVITGLIKANVPSRISFRLATKVDSRTILDTNGAESLLGRGDMLFLPPGTSRLVRLHAPYVSEKETAAVVGFWKAQGEAEYVEGFLESPKDDRPAVEGSNSDPDENDPLFNDAVQLVFEFGKASTSLLQRRLRIGYGRAAHLIDLMERDGLVGPADGSKPRELLKAPGWLHEVSATALE